MSGRRGDSDFTLQEGGNGTLPPPMPTYAHKAANPSSGVFWSLACLGVRIFYLRRSVVLVVVGGFWGILGEFFGSPMYTQNGCIKRNLFFKIGVCRGNFSSNWVHPEKTFF